MRIFFLILSAFTGADVARRVFKVVLWRLGRLGLRVMRPIEGR